MKSQKFASTALVIAALLAPAVSMAAGEWHQENTDRGASYHPEHAKSPLSRAQVQGEARATEPDRLVREGAPLDTFPTAAADKNREQVRAEVLGMTAAEKQRLQTMYRGN